MRGPSSPIFQSGGGLEPPLPPPISPPMRLSFASLLAIENLKMKNDLKKVEDVSSHNTRLLLNESSLFVYAWYVPCLICYPFGPVSLA